MSSENGYTERRLRRSQYSEHLLEKSATARQASQFDSLSTPKVTTTLLNPDWTIINLLEENVSEAAKSMLSKRLNFAPAPSIIPYQDCIRAIKPAIRSLLQESAEDIHSKIALALKKVTPPEPNLSRDEKAALKEL
ncbi:hypothetical protein J437_LFUL010033 [Ladona fulva]|uniref:Uncharacterized protein n=1 Tax=Ladona fulva TaxID=123851 RepID=A0A8K0K9W2_LADFU|nr:hypothetical protein J437_LFUL010033 [Ladona fulva]